MVPEMKMKGNNCGCLQYRRGLLPALVGEQVRMRLERARLASLLGPNCSFDFCNVDLLLLHHRGDRLRRHLLLGL